MSEQSDHYGDGSERAENSEEAINVEAPNGADMVRIGRAELQLVDEHGEVMEVDHTSSMDGYIAFRSENGKATIHLGAGGSDE